MITENGVLGSASTTGVNSARPASGYHAAFSGPYTVAAALLGGGLGVSHEDFTDAAARDPRRLALAALVRCVEDERCSASFPHAFPAVLRVTTRTGEELEARVEVNRGGPGNPLSDEELARKFHDNAVRSLPEERAAEIAARTLALPDAQSVGGSHRAAEPRRGALRSRQLPLPDCVGQVGHPLRRLRADRLQGHAARVHALEQADSGAEQHG